MFVSVSNYDQNAILQLKATKKSRTFLYQWETRPLNFMEDKLDRNITNIEGTETHTKH